MLSKIKSDPRETTVEVTKSSLFMSPKNQTALLKMVYVKHVQSGGKLEMQVIKGHVEGLLAVWPVLREMDGYESLVHDMPTEIEEFNRKFTAWVMQSLDADDDYRTLTATYKMTPDDYRNLDARGGRDLITDNSMYRYNNTIPIYRQIMHARPISHDNGGMLKGRSLGTMQKGFGMSSVLERMNETAKPMDHLDTPYFGHLEDDSTLGLLSTA